MVPKPGDGGAAVGAPRGDFTEQWHVPSRDLEAHSDSCVEMEKGQGKALKAEDRQISAEAIAVVQGGVGNSPNKGRGRSTGDARGAGLVGATGRGQSPLFISNFPR